MKLILALVVATSAQVAPTDDDRAAFAQWKIQYGKEYANGEEETRFQNYIASRAKAAELDAQNPLATFGENEFSDLSEEEFAAWYLNSGRQHQVVDPAVPEWPAYPEEQVAKALDGDIDWVSKGAVTPVKNQGHCGSCWAHSTTGNIEGQWFIAKGELVSLSEQQLVSCDKGSDHGCKGGLEYNAFKYVQSKGLETEEQYPYEGRDSSCKGESSPAVHVDGRVRIQKDEGQILTRLQQKGPVSIGVDAGKWKNYKSGILTSCSSSSKLNHSVLIVGYGTEGGKKYWKIKNSWGTSFGESGYIRVAYGINCAGMKNDASSSVVNSDSEVAV